MSLSRLLFNATLFNNGPYGKEKVNFHQDNASPLVTMTKVHLEKHLASTKNSSPQLTHIKVLCLVYTVGIITNCIVERERAQTTVGDASIRPINVPDYAISEEDEEIFCDEEE